MLVKIKFYVPEIFLGIFLTVAIFAMGMVFESSRAPNQHEEKGTAEQNTRKKVNENDPKTQSLWVPTDSVGLYTLVLAAFTGLLVGVSGVQGYFLLRADRTARITAEAAQKSADAAIAADRARLYVIIEHNFLDCIKTAGTWENTPSVDEKTLAASNLPMAKFNFKNYGKTPGILIEVGSGIAFSETVPDPVYDVKVVKDNIIPFDQVTEDFNEVISPSEMTFGAAKKVRNGAGHIWIYGYAIYDDVFGQRQTHRFFQRLVGVSGGFRFVLQSYDYKHYNRST